MHMRKSSSSRRRVGMCLCPLISYTQNVLSKNNQTISAVRKINIKAEISKYNYFRKNIITNEQRMNRVNNFHEDPAKIRKSGMSK